MARSQLTRRTFMQAAGGASVASVGLGNPPAHAQAKELVFVSWGGSYQEAQRKAHLAPFQTATGIKITEIPGGPRLAKLKAQVDTGNIEWGVMDLEASDMLRAGKEGLLEPIDRTVVDTSKIVPEGVDKFGIMNVYYSMVFGYSTMKYPPGQPHPKGWADFWNVAKFPGPRCLKDTPKGLLEAALIAEGVPQDKLYPIDVERAFKKLDQIKRHVVAWYTGAAQVVQLLAAGEVVLANTSHNRLGAAIADGAAIGIDWTDARLDSDFWSVPKGTPQKEIAMKFIASAIDARQQAEMAKLTGLGPSNLEAMKHLSEVEADKLPSAPVRYAQQYWTNNAWWLEHEAALQRRFEAWKLA